MLHMPCTPNNKQTWAEICMLVVLGVLVWLWYAATQDNNADKEYNTALVYIILILNVFVVWIVKKKNTYVAIFAFVLWLAFLANAARLLPNNLNNISILRMYSVYWLAVASVCVALYAVLTFSTISKKEKDSMTADDLKKQVLMARRIALGVVFCLLDLYTVYLLHEIAVIVHEETGTQSTDFMDKWHESVVIQPEVEERCDVVDTEMEKYGLIYHNQIVHNTTGSTDFECLFQLHESVRLNMLCGIVAWTIYRLSTHENSVHLLSTAVVFLALSTTVDDLRSYWVLDLEQAVFLTIALVLEMYSLLRASDVDIMSAVKRNVQIMEQVSANQSYASALPEDDATGLLAKPNHDAHNLVLNF